MVATPMATRSGGRSWVSRGRRSSGGLGLRLLAKLLRGRTLFDAAVNPGPLPCREAPECDEAGGRALVEGAVRVVGGEFLVVERPRCRASHYCAGSLIQPEANGPANGPLR